MTLLPKMDDHNMLPAVKQFEAELDAELDGLASLQYSGDDCIHQAANIIETAATKAAPGVAELLAQGLQALAPRFVGKSEGPRANLEVLVRDLYMAGHYFRIRDLLYYSYNAPGSVVWDFAQEEVTISFADRTIPRQFYLEFNQFVVGSSELFAEYEGKDRIVSLLRLHPEGTIFRELDEVSALIHKEVETKLGAYYSLLDHESATPLGSYTYAQFFRVYRELLATALYHRYQSKANDAIGGVTWPRIELVANLSEATALPMTICSAVLDEITFDHSAATERLEPVHFGLYALSGSERVLMIPHRFAVWEGLIGILRLVALRRPRTFLREVSGPLGAALVKRVQKNFEEQGFKVSLNVRLDRFDPSLPDIDLLVVSEERTLGYVVFVCEVKNPIPPQWAKDHLRVLDGGSIAKAFTQLDAIGEFLRSKSGVEFLRSRLPPSGLPDFGQEFVVLVREVIVTSANAGMLFGHHERTVIDYRTLARLLKRSDGDVAYVLQALSQLNSLLDASFESGYTEFMIGPRRIRYEGVKPLALTDFAENEYRSVGRDREIAEDFVREGHHPFDSLPE